MTILPRARAGAGNTPEATPSVPRASGPAEFRCVRRAGLLLALLLPACGGTAPEASSVPFTPVADTQQLMATILEPASEVYWDAVGWIVDASGTTEIRPSTPEEWEAVRNAAFVIAESGNLLMMEGRAPDGGPWMGMAQAMTETAVRAIAVAEARDAQGVFDVGAEVYFTCTACHATYAVQTLNPADRVD